VEKFGIIEVGRGGGKNFTFKSDQFFSVSGDSKHKKNFRQKKLVLQPQLGEGGGRHFVVGTTQKYKFYIFTPPLKSIAELLELIIYVIIFS